MYTTTSILSKNNIVTSREGPPENIIVLSLSTNNSVIVHTSYMDSVKDTVVSVYLVGLRYLHKPGGSGYESVTESRCVLSVPVSLFNLRGFLADLPDAKDMDDSYRKIADLYKKEMKMLEDLPSTASFPCLASTSDRSYGSFTGKPGKIEWINHDTHDRQQFSAGTDPHGLLQKAREVSRAAKKATPASTPAKKETVVADEDFNP